MSAVVAREDTARCPFLREAQVRWCRASSFHKMIVRAPGGPENERCSSPEYVSCPAAREHREEHPSPSHCPFLCESLVQYCAAAPVTKFIPYTEPMQTRCGTSRHRYCEVFMSLSGEDAKPVAWSPGAAGDEDGPAGSTAARVPMPRNLAWARNHMWIDEESDGTCHVGVDAFLTGTFGAIDAVDFPVTSGYRRPTAVLRVNDVDVTLTFPALFVVTGVNTGARAHPYLVGEEPYRGGWLFEGRALEVDARKGRRSPDGLLLRGSQAARWMRGEVERMNRFAHDALFAGGPEGVLAADGGEPVHGFARALDREHVLTLVDLFFRSADPAEAES